MSTAVNTRVNRYLNQLQLNGVSSSPTPESVVKTVSRSNGVAVVQINYPPANGWNEYTSVGVLNAYKAACNDSSIKAVVITGTGANFVAGADINKLQRQQQDPSTSKQSVIDGINKGHKILEQLESGPLPTVAAINGFALGGGCELAMGCNARVAVSNAAIGLPELSLGIIPGLAGTQRLPRLIGVEAAVPATLTGKHIKAADALKLGLVDAVVAPAQLIDAACKLALDIASGKVKRKQSSKLDNKINKESAIKFIDVARVDAVKRARGTPQAGAYLDAVRYGIENGFDAGIKREAEIFAELITGPVSAALVHYFFASRATSKIKDIPIAPSGTAIQTVAVIGGGTMGAGICIAYLMNGYNVILKELNDKLCLMAIERILEQVNRVLKKRKLPSFGAEMVLRNFSTTTTYDQFHKVDLVIEAVLEKLPLKQQIFGELEKVCREDAILATNTSTIDILRIGEKTQASDRIVGLHFFSPAHIMPLLEIVRSEKTSAQTLSQCLAMAKRIKKTPVVAGNCPGFIANRAFFPYGQVAGFLVDAGLTPYQVDAAVLKFGMPMGPFRMGDLSGIDIGVNAAQTFLDAYPDRTYKSTLAKELVAAKRFGEKTKQGYYKYVNGKNVPDLEGLQPFIEKSRQVGKQHNIPDLTKLNLSERDIQEIIFYPVINECARIVGEGYAQSTADVDVAAITGYGFPAAKGGLMFWANSTKPGQGGGYKRVVERLQYFSDTFGKDSPKIKSFFAPSNELKQLAQKSSN